MAGFLRRVIMSKKKQTAHEKRVELAKASAPQYGIYIDGGDIEKMIEAAGVIGPIVMDIVSSESNEKTKQMAISLIKDAVPSVDHCTITNCNLRMAK